MLVSTLDRIGIRNVRVFTVHIPRRVILAHNELRVLNGIHKSAQRMEIGGRIRTPYEASKMVPGPQVTTAHPSCVVLFQTT